MSNTGSLSGRLRFDLADAALQKGGGKGIRNGLEVLLARSRAEVPKDTGALAASGRVEIQDALTGRVVYDARYAIVQHERTDFAHPRGGKAKYLEDPASSPDVKQQMMDSLGTALREALNGS